MYRILCDSYVLYDPRLPDLFVFEPDLTQKKNEPGELSFTIPKEHPHYGVLEKLKSLIKVYRDDTLIWIGRVIEDERDLYESRKVVAEGALSFLLDSTDAHLFRKYISRRLQTEAAIITPIFLLGKTKN